MPIREEIRQEKLRQYRDFAQTCSKEKFLLHHGKELRKLEPTDEEWLYIFDFEKDLAGMPLMRSDLVIASQQTPESSFPKPTLLEEDGNLIHCEVGMSFSNWDGHIKNKPRLTFAPKTIAGIQQIVKWAAEQTPPLRVRASGFRHSSSDAFSDNDQVLISMLPLRQAITVPLVGDEFEGGGDYFTLDETNPLQRIELVGEPFIEEGETKHLCKIGAGVCNFHFQRWVHSPTGGKEAWALPFNVVMTEITFAGSNALMCHGAGIKNATLSDLVTEVEFINVYGERQSVNNPEVIKAAAGAFGMLGIVISLTLKLNQMSYANFKSVTQEKLELAVPLPEEYYALLPASYKPKSFSEARLQVAMEDFTKRCGQYYSEFVWFPGHKKVWINCWDNDGAPTKKKRYPSHETQMKMQRFQMYVGNLFQHSIFAKNWPKLATLAIGSMAMSLLPDKKDVVCTLEDAEHFKHGIHNILCKIVEVEVDIPSLAEDPEKPDFSLCQKLWWDVHFCLHQPEFIDTVPLRMPLEMRIMRGSQVPMAPQFGAKWICSIEVLTSTEVDDELWKSFVQALFDRWSQYATFKPHWAKRHEDFEIRRAGEAPQTMTNYLQNVYKNQTNLFFKQLNKIGASSTPPYSVKTMKQRFWNKALDTLFEGEVSPKPSL